MLKHYAEKYPSPINSVILPHLLTQSKKIGSGAFGTVFRATYPQKNVHVTVAVKIIHINPDHPSDNPEIEIWNHCFLMEHNIKHVPKLHGFHNNMLIMEFFPYTVAQKIRQINCGMELVSPLFFLSTPSKYICSIYWLSYKFCDKTSNFVYHDAETQNQTVIPIDVQKHAALMIVHKNKTTKKLSPRQLADIEIITGHKPPKKDGLSPDHIKKIVTQGAIVLGDFKRIGFVHRDIKPENMGITPEGDLKLCDFGLSSTPNIRHRPGDPNCTNAVGSPYFMAPEAFDGRGNTYAADMYSYACVLFCLLVIQEKHPLVSRPDINTFSALRDFIVDEELRDTFPADYPHLELKQVIENAWEQNPEKRSTPKVLRQGLERCFANSDCLHDPVPPKTPLPVLTNSSSKPADEAVKTHVTLLTQYGHFSPSGKPARNSSEIVLENVDLAQSGSLSKIN